MNRGERKASHRITGQFAARTIEMLRSPAMRVLSLTGRRILDRIEIELADHRGRDNGKLPVTFADLMEFGIGNRHLIAPGIRELCALGFTELTRRGRASNGEYRTPNLFRLTYRPAGGAAPTNEWRSIATVEQAERIACEARGATRKDGQGKNSFLGAENHTDPGVKTTPITGAENNTDRPNSPVPKTTPLSRKDLPIYGRTARTQSRGRP
jgi:hypothetical protein